MSRNIGKKTCGPTEEELALRKQEGGRLVLTRYGEKYLGLLLRDGRLLAASAAEDRPGRIGAVYIGKVKNVVRGIEACFVEIADEELCFLPFGESGSPYLLNRAYDGRILEGDELLVQLAREAVKTKQASVTAEISIAGRLMVLAAGPSRANVSAKLSPERRKELLQLLQKCHITDEKGFVIQRGAGKFPAGKLPSYGIVLRTQAGELADSSLECLLEEYESLLERFGALLEAAGHRTCFSCVLEGPPAFQAVLSDIYPWEYTEAVTDIAPVYEAFAAYIHENRGQRDVNVRLYGDEAYSLGKLYSVETKLQEALSSRAWLKSGGYLVIEPTEALTVIDVNTGKCGSRKKSEDTFFHINMEAAAEIALQLRLRNLSGIIIVDFINLESPEKRRLLMEELKKLALRDPVKTVVVDMTPLGLVEITRRKINMTLKEQLECGGTRRQGVRPE